LSYEITFRERKTITGKRYLLTANPEILKINTFINLDFSFREKVTLIEKNPLITEYPMRVTAPIYYMGMDEIVAEKIRAILTREKGRDLYDLWFLLLNGGVINKDLVKEKLEYYGDKNLSIDKLPQKINDFSVKMYCDDLRPFVTYKKRELLERDFEDIKEFLNSGRLNL